MCLVLWRFLLILTPEVFHFFWSVFRVWFGFFFSLLLSVCVWVRVGVRGCARGVRVPGVSRGMHRCIFLYKLELESGSVA